METLMASTRLLWTSARAREVWEPRIRAVAEAWLSVELASVRAGVRGAALVFRAERVRASGLPAVDLGGDRWAVGPLARQLASAYVAGNDLDVGRLLHFPTCCRQFFHSVRVPGDVDTTGQMAGAESEAGPVACNILGRWLGVRLVPHLPCSFHCVATCEYAERFYRLWPEPELSWARELLSWPVEWSARHGVAEVKYPILKLVTPTTVEDTQVVQRPGTAYPDEGARGVTFPFLTPRTWRDNGFSTYAAMYASHSMVVGALREAPPQGRVLDLGAGNGVLMRRLASTFSVPVQGVEVVPAKAALHEGIVVADLRAISTLSLECDTVVVSQRRFEEMPQLKAWVSEHARQCCIYSYDEPMFVRVESCISDSKMPVTSGSPTAAG